MVSTSRASDSAHRHYTGADVTLLIQIGIGVGFVCDAYYAWRWSELTEHRQSLNDTEHAV